MSFLLLAHLRHLDLKQLRRVQITALPAYAKVEVRTGSPPRRAAERDRLATTNLLAHGYFDLRQMHVDAHQAESVIDDYAAALVIERPREHNTTGVDRCYRGAHLRPIIETTMDAVELAVEDALIAEGVGLRREMQRRTKVSRPLRLRGRLGKGFVLHDLVGGDFFQSCGVWLDKFIRHTQRYFFVGRLFHAEIFSQRLGRA